jgi:acyl dehydratase
MSSRSAAKKLSKPGKPARGAKPKAIMAKGKPRKKPLAKVARIPKKALAKVARFPKKALAKVTRFPKQPQAPRPSAHKASTPPAPPAPPRPPLLGMPPPGFHGARPGSPSRLASTRTPLPPVRPSLSPGRSPLPPAAKPMPGKTPMPPTPPRTGMPPPKKPLGMAELRSGPVQTTPARQSLARSFYWSELRVGDDLPPLNKPAVDRVQIARYAAAANDYNRLHLDEPFAHGLGFPGTFAPGALAMGFVGQLLTSWLRRGHVRRLSARFIKFVWPGDELTCRGRIAELRKENGACYADVELWAENRKGELVLRGQATCELYESPGSASTEGAGLLFALDHGARSAHSAGKGGGPARPVQKTPSKPPPAAKNPPSFPPKKK